MADLKLFLPVFFLLSLSFGLVFGDSGSLSVVSGKSYQINYNATFAQILGAQPNKDDQSLLFSIQATEPTATLELTLPRELIDATKKDGSDDNFIVLVDGTFSSYLEKSATQTSRTILVQLVPDNKELEIIGTYLAGYNSGNTQQTSTPIPAIPKQTNQTSQQNPPPEKLTEGSFEKPSTNTSKQNLSAQEILSKIFQFNLLNSSSNVSNIQIIEYSVIASAILIVIIVITSSKKSKTRKQIRK